MKNLRTLRRSFTRRGQSTTESRAWVAERIGRDVKPGAKVAVLGMSFKANIDDTRESPSVLFANILKEKGYEVIACEPFIRGDVAGYKNHTLEEAIAACDYAVITLMHTPFVENKALIGDEAVLRLRRSDAQITNRKRPPQDTSCGGRCYVFRGESAEFARPAWRGRRRQ